MSTLAADSLQQLRRPDPDRSVPTPLLLFYWSIRREVWESRLVLIAPVAAGAVVLLGFVLGLGATAQRRRVLLGLDPLRQAVDFIRPYDIAATAVVLTAIVAGVTYCLGALYGERRDRSILFWKSLPVSDLTTVLAKAAIPLAILPAVAFVVSVVLQILMLLVGGAVLTSDGLPVVPPAVHIDLWARPIVLLYGLVTFTLWWSPLYAWFLLVSGWARRVPFLWAVLPPVGFAVVEKVALDGTQVAAFLRDRLLGGYGRAFTRGASAGSGGIRSAPSPTLGLSDLDPSKFLSSPGVWGGLVVAGGLLAGAVWLRRRREPI